MVRRPFFFQGLSRLRKQLFQMIEEGVDGVEEGREAAGGGQRLGEGVPTGEAEGALAVPKREGVAPLPQREGIGDALINAEELPLSEGDCETPARRGRAPRAPRAHPPH